MDKNKKGRPLEGSPKQNEPSNSSAPADPFLGWFELGEHARLHQQKRKPRKAVRK